MPAWIHLNEFADQCERLGGEVYLVGSALRTKRPRDVDIRQEVPDSRFRELFWDMREFGKPGSGWATYCAALSTLGRQMTGRPIDFQIEPYAVSLRYRDDPKMRIGSSIEALRRFPGGIPQSDEAQP